MFYKNELFQLYSHSKNKIEVELDLSNYATKFDLKNTTGVDTLQFSKKDDLDNLKLEVDKLDVDKLEKLNANELKPVPTDLNKLSDVVKNDVAKKDIYNAKIEDIDDKIPDIINLATNTAVNAKG